MDSFFASNMQNFISSILIDDPFLSVDSTSVHPSLPGTLLVAPMFSKKTLAQQRNRRLLPGNPLHLVCQALANPRATISWRSHGREVAVTEHLEVEQVSMEDSGVYTCVASNLAGSAQLEFSVTVESPRVELPSISKVGNVSAMVGEAAVLQCKVTSSLPPSVQWLRKVDEVKQEEAILTIANMHLVSVAGQNQDNRMVNLPEGNYLDTLVIDRVTTKDAGLYVCFATNTAGGFNYQSAHLDVVGKENNLDIDFLPVVAAALALVLLVLVVGGIVAHQPAKSSVPSSPECKAKQVVISPSPGPGSKISVPNFYCPPSHTASWASLERSSSYVCLPPPHHVYDLPFNQLPSSPSPLSLQSSPGMSLQSSLPPPLSTPLYRLLLLLLSTLVHPLVQACLGPSYHNPPVFLLGLVRFLSSGVKSLFIIKKESS